MTAQRAQCDGDMIVMQGFLTAKKYTYSIVGSEDLEKANSLLYDTYHPDEPLNRCSMSY